ncbi:NAD(P)H-binding protein [Salinicoccus roseus]|uniref:NAD(P)H-binding protein n=1 Tax=Salinicoccus roseus TaxID=45670 RepID=UPI001CA78113|nr:NAD(P)H-binding protein [Salinicoccus roseus]MBY8909124.1 NAD(P)H-binding protein [Salinicoccus roseus]
MKVCVFGGGEAVGEHVLKLLDAAGHDAVTMAETENRAEEMKMLGAAEVFISGSGDFSKALAGADAVIYIPGAGSGAAESQDALVDHEAVGAVLEAARHEQLGRIVYLSAVRTDEPEETKETGEKHKPEAWVEDSSLTYTVIRAAKTVSKPGKGTIEAAESLDCEDAEMPYEDVAAVLVEALDNENTFHKTFEVTAGDMGVKEALDAL